MNKEPMFLSDDFVKWVKENYIRWWLNGIIRTPKDFNKPINDKDLPHKTLTNIYMFNDRKNYISMKKSFGVDIDKDIFLTIFDSCYSFVSEMDFSEVQKLVDTTSNLAKEPMKGVWKPRAFHHIFLIVDGLCKQRCLFRDYDSSFKAKQEDYDLAERILIRMVKAWDTDLRPKENFTK